MEDIIEKDKVINSLFVDLCSTIPKQVGDVISYLFVELSWMMQDDSKVSKGAKIRNRYNQVPHLTQDTNEKVKNSH